jgi:hypothetical protein
MQNEILRRRVKALRIAEVEQGERATVAAE